MNKQGNGLNRFAMIFAVLALGVLGVLGLRTAGQPVLAAAGPGYHVINSYKLGGIGGWDYLIADPDSRRVYITRGSHVMVVDADSGKVVGDIADTPGVHGVALAPELGKGFTSNGGENMVSVFDLKTLKTLSKIKVGERPDAILYDPHSKRVFTFNAKSEDTTAVDAEKGTVAGTIPLGGKPEFAASDGKGDMFVNIEDKGEIVSFDPVKLTVKARWKLAGCEEPSGLGFDRKHRRLFPTCGNKVMPVVNADNGKIVQTVAICDGPDAGGFDDDNQLAFASCGDGTLTVIKEESPDKYSVAENATTKKRARTMTFDSKTHQVYLVTAEFGTAAAPTADQPHPRPPMVPDSFELFVMGK